MRAVLALVLCVGCADPAPPGTPQWTPPRDTGADTSDASVEVEVEDAGEDDGGDSPEDVGVGEDVRRDSTRDPIEPEPVEDPCAGAEAETCRRCDEGSVCAPGVCTGEVCAPGRYCTRDADCGAEGECVDETGTCQPATGECADSRSCPYGFRCEDGACTDRRIACSAGITPCPRGYICSFAVVSDYPFCVPGIVPCDDVGTCEPGASCVDVDGDGSTECVPAGLCTTHDDCPAELRCGVDPTTGQADCVDDGACRDGACAIGYECRDVGAGVQQCVASGGACLHDRECAPGSVCASSTEGAPPRCTSSMEDGS